MRRGEYWMLRSKVSLVFNGRDAISIAISITPQAWTWIGKAGSTLKEPFKLGWNFMKHWIIFMFCISMRLYEWSPLLEAHDFAVLGASGHESSYRLDTVSQFLQVFRWLTLAAAYWHSQSNKWQVMIPPSALGSLLLLSRRKPLVLMLASAGVISCQPEYQLTVRLKPLIHAILAQAINQGESYYRRLEAHFVVRGLCQWI